MNMIVLKFPLYFMLVFQNSISCTRLLQASQMFLYPSAAGVVVMVAREMLSTVRCDVK